MLKRIYSYLIILAAAFSVLISCDDDETIGDFSSLVDVSNSPLKDEKYHVVLQFSTDNGATFVDYPVLKVGQSYKVRAIHRDAEHHVDTEINAANCYDVDWSTADPKPNGESIGDVAEFTMRETNKIVAKVTNHITPFSASYWSGIFSATEDYGTSLWGPYEIELVQDGSNPNRFHLNNFYDSGLDAYIEFDGATGTVKFPDGQSPDGIALTNSSGTFDQCRGELTINLNYDGGDWVYRFTKE